MKNNEQHTTERVGWICGWGTTNQVWKPCIERWQDATHVMLPMATWFDRATNLDEVLLLAEAGIRNLAADAVSEGQRWRIVGWSLGGIVALGVWSLWMKSQLQASLDRSQCLSQEEMDAFQGIDLIGSSLCFVADPPHKGWSPRVIELMKNGLVSNPQELNRVLQRFREQVGLQENQLPNVGSVIEAWSLNGLLLGLDALKTWDFRENVLRFTDSDLVDQSKCSEQKGLNWLRRLRWLHGDRDRTCPVAAVPNDRWIETEIVAGLGHALFLERPDLVVEWLRG